MGAEVFLCTFVAAISSLYMQSAPGANLGQNIDSYRSCSDAASELPTQNNKDEKINQ